MANRIKEQAIIKDLKARRLKKEMEDKQNANLVGIEKLELEIYQLEHLIFSARGDLAGIFKGNGVIKSKLVNAEKQLAIKIKELNKLKNGDTTNNEMPAMQAAIQ
jgi:hypothetical protein